MVAFVNIDRLQIMKLFSCIVGAFLVAGTHAGWLDGLVKKEIGLKIRFDANLFGRGTSHFIPVPITRDEALASSSMWSERERSGGPDQYSPIKSMWCTDNMNVCVFYNPCNNHVAGLRISIAKKDFTDVKLNMTINGFYSETYNGKDYWWIEQYYVSGETFNQGSDVCNSYYDSSKLLQEDYVYAIGINHELMKMPVNGDDRDSSWEKQACIPWMGQHFYKDMTSKTVCNSETVAPWFILENSNKLMGVCFMAFGKLEVEEGTRLYFENPPELAVRAIVNNGPECLYDMSKDGTLTMHIYFTGSPGLIGC